MLHSRAAFASKQQADSLTNNCQAGTRDHYVNGQQKTLMVVDTPGFFDTDPNKTNEMVQNTISSQIFKMTSPGVHAFLITVRIGRITPEETNTLHFLQQIFGPDAARYCIIVFTHEDQLDEGQSINSFIHSFDYLRDLVVNYCGNRVFTINNKLQGEPLIRKTNELLQMIDQMVQYNGGTYYTNAMYQMIERELRAKKEAEEERRRREKEEEEEEIWSRVSLLLKEEFFR